MNKEFHEVANIFPLMEGDPFKELCTDIASNGLIEPIWLWQDKIVDGRNRYRACMEIGIQPDYREWKGTEEGLLPFVLALNLKRRHLTASQRAATGVAIEAYLAKQAKERQIRKPVNSVVEKVQQQNGKASEQAAKLVGTNAHYIIDAKKVKEADPRRFEQVLAGNLTLKDARKEIKAEERKEHRKQLAANGKELSIPDGVRLFLGDFRDLGDEIPDNSVDLIFTDPPYDKESIPLYGDLAKFAARVLKPGGSLIAYVGHYAVGKVCNLMAEHLRFWWLLGVKHSGASRKLVGVNVIVEWKPMVWFVKETRYGGEFVRDMLTSDAPDKKEHEWQQGHTEADYYIQHLTDNDGVIVDPFAGSGTTLISALKLGRKSIGFEIDEERYHVAKQHISDKSK